MMQKLIRSDYLQVLRKSGNADTLKCIIPEVLKDGISQFDAIEVVGEVRTRNYDRADGTRGCEVFVFVTETAEYKEQDINTTTFDGYICKEPNYRETPLGRRICDVLIASNRERNDRTDYIPCIAWDRNARRTSEMPVATKVEIVGRLHYFALIIPFSLTSLSVLSTTKKLYFIKKSPKFLFYNYILLYFFKKVN